MAEDLFSIDPGSLTPKSTVELLANRAAERIVISFPPSWQAGLALANIATAAASTITAAAVSGPLALGVAVVQLFNQVSQALNDWAASVKADIAEEWVSQLETLGESLAKAANGNILATYQPSTTLSLKRAQAYTGGSMKKLSQLKAQFRPGYVMGVKRGAYSDYIVSTVPILVFGGCPLTGTIRQSIYTDKPQSWIPPTGTLCDKAYGWDGHAWRWAGLADYSDVSIPGFKWASTAAELKNAVASPPVRQSIKVAPGLAPQWGAYGDTQPVSQSLAAYSTAMLGSPPKDLDAVCAYLQKAHEIWPNFDAAYQTPILDILWAREDLARRGEKGLKPRGDAWAGPFWQAVGLPEPSAQKGGGKFPGMFGEGKKLANKPSGGGGGGGGGLLLVAAGAAGLVLLRRKRR